MIRDQKHAAAVRERRAKAGKTGVPHAVRRFYKRVKKGAA